MPAAISAGQSTRYSPTKDCSPTVSNQFSGLVTSVRAKSRKTRAVPLNETALRILRGLPYHGEEARVFGYRAIGSLFVAARRAAGLPEDLKLHSLRRTFATRAVRQGIDLRTVQAWLGHHSLEETEGYVETDPSYDQQAIRLLDGPHRSPHTPPGHSAEA